jgi:hypothetical protein
MLGWYEKSTCEERRLNVLRWPCVIFDVDVVRVNGGSCRLKDLDLKNEEACAENADVIIIVMHTSNSIVIYCIIYIIIITINERLFRL